MTAQELRQKYLDFFKSKGHTIIPSASLIPENDPTVLFTTAGMHPLVPYLLGEVHPGGKRVASVQKCIRTGDIDEVGDDVHLTFFEMFGNWSFGDYWKQEAISWSFEFLTKELKLPLNKLAVTCFAGDKDAPRDEESAGIWKSLGIPENRIYFLGKSDNWWGPAGQTGPCGPDTEMFYWTGQGEPPDLVTGDNKEGWVEIWNDVFMQYNKTADGKFEPLKQRNVDTGMGLERTLAVLNGRGNVYETELFLPIIKCVNFLRKYHAGGTGFDLYAHETNKNYFEIVKAVRIIVDHIKAATFIMGDSKRIKPSNIGQGYVLRKIIRRAIRYGRLVGINKDLLIPVSNSVIELYKDIYPEIEINKSSIISEFFAEEEKFNIAIEKGREQLLVSKEVTGAVAFDLYQSYGLPLEVTKDEARANNLTMQDEKQIDSEFASKLAQHQELSSTASAGMFKGGLADSSEEVVMLHTATHLLDQALRDVLGKHVEQRGSNITKERLRFDFSHPAKMTPEEVSQVEKIVNEKIKEDLPVHFELLTVEEAKSRGAIGIFDDKYAQLGNKIKVYFVGDYSTEICGGPHVEHTGQIGSFKILKEEAVAAGIRRIKATVG